MLALIIIQYIVSVFGLALLVNYHSVAIPFLHYPSMLTSSSTETHYLKNGALYLLFWLQHVAMATLKYKINWQSQFKHFVLYDRYIYNIASGLTLWFVFSQLEPSNIYLFTIPNWVCLPFKVAGICMLTLAMRQLGGRVMMPWSIRQILNEKLLSYVPYGTEHSSGLKTDGIYAISRNPMQAAALLLILFSNGRYTTEKVLFVVVMGVGVVVGVLMEEKRMLKQFKEYQQYMEKVKARFIPLL